MANTLIAHFTKRFPSGAVIRCELNRPTEGHSITVLFGPSGCGKTTLLRSFAGLERPEEGRIQFGGEIWSDAKQGLCLAPQRRRVGFVFQDYALFPHLTCEQNISYGLRDLAATERRGRVGEMMERFELTPLAQQRPRQLSGGQQQRVALARALVCRPRLLLLDEPLSALDATLRHQLRGELRKLLATCDIPVFLVTHDLAEVLALGDELVVMNGGNIRQTGPVLEVFHRPTSVEVAKILGVETVQSGSVSHQSEGQTIVRIGSAELRTEAKPGAPRDLFVCIRGEEVTLQPEGTAVGKSTNCLPASIVSVQPGSPLIGVHLDAGFPLFAAVPRTSCQRFELSPGNRVMAVINPRSVHLIWS